MRSGRDRADVGATGARARMLLLVGKVGRFMERRNDPDGTNN